MEASELTEPVAPPNGSEPEAWSVDKQGREWIARKDGRPGRIIRRDGETVEQARARDSDPEERRPRRRPKAPPKPPAPKKADLKKLEEAIAVGLQAPGIASMTLISDEWLAQHFQVMGPYFARNLVMAADYNPWLRRKLEEAATGEEALMKVVGIMGIAGGAFMYFAPPMIYLLNLPVPEKTREMMRIPPRRQPQPQQAPPPAPEPPQEPEYAADPLEYDPADPLSVAAEAA